MSERFRERPVGLSPCLGDGRAVLEVDDRKRGSGATVQYGILLTCVSLVGSAVAHPITMTSIEVPLGIQTRVYQAL
ncbi:hypothetical protein CEP54_011763 [Fusarium duplospermum]|uniref:Uncharacterized protein n=1 Tax=Fusarium duplospermum TaxID=1325734 RepID=A0A428PCQ2_9HYPO|nr:hypothetical protein CEP54_011763 [Fusarium duplospermum]